MQKVNPPAQGHLTDNSVSLRIAIVVLTVLAVVTCVAVGVSIRRQAALQESNAQCAASVLDPIAVLIAEDQKIIHELQTQPFAENGKGILESYLIRIRAAGVPKNAEMKQRLDRLAENNAAIVTLIKVYAPHARTAAFTTAGDNFRNYAATWRDRWNSVMELFMSGGDYAAAGIPFPPEMAGALANEATAAQ
jgi:hypothetical protein